jgi:hypothetical protein
VHSVVCADVVELVAVTLTVPVATPANCGATVTPKTAALIWPNVTAAGVAVTVVVVAAWATVRLSVLEVAVGKLASPE